MAPSRDELVRGQMVGTGVRWTVCAAAIVAVLVLARPAGAETLESALALAYRNNPTLNAQRASLRACLSRVDAAEGGMPMVPRPG